jgi:hypothetical protein
MAPMSELLPLLLVLACPLGMLAMVAAPALVRRFTRRTQPSTATPPRGTGTDEHQATRLATAGR